MMGSRVTSGTTVARVKPVNYASKHVWAVVLAGGEGVRLRALIRQLLADERPKQYVPLVGAVSLLRQTLDRVAWLIPDDRTVIVSQQHHARHIAGELGGMPTPHVLFQPQDRGTAAAVLFATHWIAQKDPEATVVVFPADHFLEEEAAFLTHIAEVIAFVHQQPEWLVLAGAQPTEPEPEYGWIKPGEPVGATTSGGIFRVRAFWEKPDAGLACRYLADGWLWNTLVFVVTAKTLIAAGWEFLPTFLERLAHGSVFAGTEHEAWALRQTYALAPTTDFSRSLLQSCPPFLAVSKLPPLAWSDLGSPARLVRTLSALRVQPPWMLELPHRRGRLTHAVEGAESA
jgi:mannose-1-phosphate guanylyltransferase